MSRNRQRREAERLTFSYGLSKPLALQVVRGQLDLTEALRQDKQEKTIERLVVDHELHRSLAVQISRGELDETEVLNRVYGKRMIADNQDKSIWSLAMNENTAIHVYLHNKENRIIEISGIEQYDIVCNDGIRIPKLGIKLAHLSNDAMVFEQQEAASCSPIERPEKRYRLSNTRLFSFHQSARALQVSILEGLVCTGRLIWFNQWELGFDNAHGEFSVFRHAVTHLK